MDDPRIAYLISKYTPEGLAGNPPIGYGNEYLFFVGRDDVHGILLYLLQNESRGIKLNMFGYDDDQLNKVLMAMIKNPSLHVQISLDKSQASGVHEHNLIQLDQKTDPVDFANSFVILQSRTHQISHTKGGVLLGQGLYFEGSTNWSDSGEGTGINLIPGTNTLKGFKAQNNTLLVSSNPVNFRHFAVELDVEHQAGLRRQNV